MVYPIIPFIISKVKVEPQDKMASRGVAFAVPEPEPQAGGEAQAYEYQPALSRRKTLAQKAIAKVKSKAKIEILVLAVFNMAIALTFLLMKLIDLMIVLGVYKTATPGYFKYHIALYAVHDRDVYYSKSKSAKGETSAPLISIICDLMGFLLYTVGSILLLLAETKLIRSAMMKRLFVVLFVTSCIVCGFLTIPTKWIFWGAYDHFVHDDEYLVVCTPATATWGHVGGKALENLSPEDLKHVFTAGRSFTYSTAMSCLNFALQVCDGFNKVYRKLYGNAECTCTANSKGSVMATVHLVNCFLAFLWIIVTLAALWFSRQVKQGNPEFIGARKPKPTPAPSQVPIVTPNAEAPGAEQPDGGVAPEASTAPTAN